MVMVAGLSEREERGRVEQQLQSLLDRTTQFEEQVARAQAQAQAEIDRLRSVLGSTEDHIESLHREYEQQLHAAKEKHRQLTQASNARLQRLSEQAASIAQENERLQSMVVSTKASASQEMQRVRQEVPFLLLPAAISYPYQSAR